jgi:hypothetical protein
VNVWAVLPAAIASMVIGFLWYSPLLFAKPGMTAMGYDPEDKARIAAMQKSAGPKYGVSFLASLLAGFCAGDCFSPVDYNLLLWYEGGVRSLDRLHNDGSANRQAVWGSALEPVSYASLLAMGAILGRWAGA